MPIGLFFLIVGVVLASTKAAPAPLTAAPVDLAAGLAMVVFGGVMMWLALRKA